MKAAIALLTFFVLVSGISPQLHRIKRKVVFTKNSKFFVRLNGKDNVIPWVQIFAQGYAVRLNWDLPESIPRRHLFFKRDIDSHIGHIDSMSVVHTYYCILKQICLAALAIKNNDNCGMFCKVGDIISRSNSSEVYFFKSMMDNCNDYTTKCPYSLDSNNLLF